MAIEIATVRVANAGNAAIQEEIWTIPTAAAVRALSILSNANSAGSYWHSNFTRPVNRARRAKAETVTIRTAGFSTGELANTLGEVGCHSRLEK